MNPDAWYSFHFEVKQAYDLFWTKNQLAYEDGRIVRTKIPRVRPKAKHELDFRNKGRKKDGDYKEGNI
jgi:hypothetical protein